MIIAGHIGHHGFFIRYIAYHVCNLFALLFDVVEMFFEKQTLLNG